MRIGELSKRAGVNIQTVRFYERRKLLPEPPRTDSGYRTYADADLERVRFIKRSQRLGFTLKEIKELIEIHGSNNPRSRGSGSDGRRRSLQIINERLHLIDEEIRLLQKLRLPLAAAINRSKTEKRSVCPASDDIQQPRKKNTCPAKSARKKSS